MAPRYAIEYIDDLDDTPLDLDEVHTVRWSWLGVDYHLDTSTANLEKIEAGQVSLATVLAKSTRIGGRVPARPHPNTTPAPTPHHLLMVGCVSGREGRVTTSLSVAVSPWRSLGPTTMPTNCLPLNGFQCVHVTGTGGGHSDGSLFSSARRWRRRGWSRSE